MVQYLRVLVVASLPFVAALLTGGDGAGGAPGTGSAASSLWPLGISVALSVTRASVGAVARVLPLATAVLAVQVLRLLVVVLTAPLVAGALHRRSRGSGGRRSRRSGARPR